MIGKRLNDRYKLLQLIGGGGMSNVYLARDMILDRDVAVKILRLELSGDEQFIKRFRREAHAVASLLHQNIVEVYDVGEEENIYYIVMEYVEGPTLKQYIQNKGRLSAQEAISFMLQLSSAIEEAHRAEIVHRDIKPQNILLKDTNSLKVTDFGIAVASSSTTITQTNAVLGSVHYLSPEQARGGIANKKSDIYSLGIVFYEMLAGNPPFSGESVVSIALKHLQNETPSIRELYPDIPQSIENIILKATAKDLFHRYSSVEEMIQDLQTALLPEKMYEEKFRIFDDEDATMAIPIIKDTIATPVPPLVHKNETHEQNDDFHDEYEEEEVPKKGKKKKKPVKKSKKTNKILGVIIVILLLVSATIAAITIVPKFLQPDEITVPDVKELSYEKAFNKLSEEGLKIGDVKDIYSDSIEEGLVVKTSPEKGEVVKEGSKVTIYKSLGKQKGLVSDYVGENYYQLEKSLRELYADVSINYVNDDSGKGTITQQKPTANEKVVEKETTLELWVSEGPPKIIVSDLIGWTLKGVQEYASEKGLKLSIKEEYDDEVNEGVVISQSLAKGAEVSKGTLLEITISKGRKEPAVKENNLSYDVPYIENEENAPQKVEVFVLDKNNNYDSPIITKMITENTKITFKVTVEEGKEAKYKILRDGELIIENVISY